MYISIYICFIETTKLFINSVSNEIYIIDNTIKYNIMCIQLVNLFNIIIFKS